MSRSEFSLESVTIITQVLNDSLLITSLNCHI